MDSSPPSPCQLRATDARGATGEAAFCALDTRHVCNGLHPRDRNTGASRSTEPGRASGPRHRPLMVPQQSKNQTEGTGAETPSRASHFPPVSGAALHPARGFAGRLERNQTDPHRAQGCALLLGRWLGGGESPIFGERSVMDHSTPALLLHKLTCREKGGEEVPVPRGSCPGVAGSPQPGFSARRWRWAGTLCPPPTSCLRATTLGKTCLMRSNSERWKAQKTPSTNSQTCQVAQDHVEQSRPPSWWSAPPWAMLSLSQEVGRRGRGRKDDHPETPALRESGLSMLYGQRVPKSFTPALPASFLSLLVPWGLGTAPSRQPRLKTKKG